MTTKNAAKHPVAAIARRQLVFAAVLGVLSVATLAFGQYAFGAMELAFAAMVGWVGLATSRNGNAVLLNNLAFERVSRGQIEEAERFLAQIPARAIRRGGYIARAVATQRAMIALQRGDAQTAVAEATRVIVDPRRGLLSRAHRETQVAAAYSLRAIAYAALGQRAEALADAERAESLALTSPEAISRAALARALVVARTEGAAGLARVFSAGGARMIEYLTPRERLLARALRRMARSSRSHVYREAAKPDDVDGESEMASWVARVAPEAATFVTDAAARPARSLVAPIVTVTPSAQAAIAKSRDPASRSNRFTVKGRVVIPVALAFILFVFIFVALSVPASGAPSHAVAAFEPWRIVVYIVGAILPLLVGMVALQLRTQLRVAHGLVSARLHVARGDEARADAELTNLSGSRYDSIAGNAYLGLARLAERNGDFVRVLAACDAGIAKLSRTAAVRALHSDIALPELIALRGFALHVLGRDAEGAAERASLSKGFPSYAFAGRAHFRLALVAALRAGDLEQAAHVAHTRSVDLPLSLQDDTLCDVVLAAVDGASPDELERITGELRDDPKLQRWIDIVAPGVRDRVRATAASAADPAPARVRVTNDAIEDPVDAEEPLEPSAAAAKRARREPPA